MFNSQPDRVKFVVEKFPLGQVLAPSIYSFACPDMATNALDSLIYVCLTDAIQHKQPAASILPL